VIPAGGARAVDWGGKRRQLEWRAWILHVLHNSTAGGHVGMPALEQRCLEVAWWPRLRRDCEAWVRRCPQCRASKGQPVGSCTWRSERYTAPFRVLQIDLVGLLVPESEGQTWIMTVIDVFTLWAWFIGIKDKTATTVARALYLHVYLDLAGFPVVLRSDRGREFMNETIGEMNRLLGTVQIFGSAYHPRSQGLVEGSHLPMEHILQEFCAEHPATWHGKLPVARWAWDTTPKQALGNMSPYQVVTGLISRNPLTALLQRSERERAGHSVCIRRRSSGLHEDHTRARRRGTGASGR